MTETKYPPLIVILGPTASGKSELAMELAREIDGEIISADSRQIYKELNIGTAKPTHQDQKIIPHHLVDIINLQEEFNLKDYQELALTAISDVYKRGKRPILTGGSGLYIKAVTEGYLLPVTPTDGEFRKKMKALALEKGSSYLHNLLAKADPTSAEKIHVNDLRRIIRALEVFQFTCVSLSKHQTMRNIPPFKNIKFAINWSRDILYKRIEERVDRMFLQGLVEEVSKLIIKGYSFEGPPLDAVAYPETADYLKGKSTLSETIRLIKRNTRHFSRRQMTWFRKDKEIIWMEPK
ncbi:MAG TPA: tRNA (adenosine(37)-N6)-dimethylallyltransferase MiaA, partial [Candidatus Eremiobacteraeota bacterium]|nr:tRNA (adenosine(37)-N6)-dimethylallyltransferase MiaA [Candidatus Eremiobacteraeota bacterium]